MVSSTGLNHLISFYKKVQVHFGQNNMIGTCLQDRCNGSDQDSDALLVCPQKDIVECARKCYQDKPTIINKIPKDMKTYDNSAKSFAIVDNELAAAGSVS